MDGKPERGEVGIELFLKNEFQIGLKVGRARQARVVAQYAQLCAVGDDAPQGGVLGVEELLHQIMRGLAAAFMAEAPVGLVHVKVTR